MEKRYEIESCREYSNPKNFYNYVKSLLKKHDLDIELFVGEYEDWATPIEEKVMTLTESGWYQCTKMNTNIKETYDGGYYKIIMEYSNEYGYFYTMGCEA